VAAAAPRRVRSDLRRRGSRVDLEGNQGSWDFNDSAAVFRGRFSPSPPPPPPPPSPSPGADSREDGGGIADCSIAATFARLQDRVGKHGKPEEGVRLNPTFFHAIVGKNDVAADVPPDNRRRAGDVGGARARAR
jgi:hypothetical protein